MPGWLLTRIMKLPKRGAVDHDALARARPKRQPVVVDLDPDRAVLKHHHPMAEAVLRRRGDDAFDRLDPIRLVLGVIVVAAAEDRDARQRQAEQPPPALADLLAIDHHDLAPLLRRLQRGGGGVETLQARLRLGDRRGSGPAPRTPRAAAAAPRPGAAPGPRPARRRARRRAYSGCESCAVPYPMRGGDIAGGAAFAQASRRRRAAMWQFCHVQEKCPISRGRGIASLWFHLVKKGLLRWICPGARIAAWPS